VLIRQIPNRNFVGLWVFRDWWVKYHFTGPKLLLVFPSLPIGDIRAVMI